MGEIAGEGSDSQIADPALKALPHNEPLESVPLRATRRPTWGALVVAGALGAAYLAFVVHFSVNGLLEDDWGFVRLVDADLHGNLTLGQLWSQHNENRMFVPNGLMVALAVATHDNAKTTMIVSALVFIVTYFLFLALLQTYLRKRLTVVPVLVTGVLWFSIADWENALWAFQFAWYLILLFFMAMLVLLIGLPSERRRPFVVAAAVVVAVLASYSSAQGTFLWPVGLLCLLWPLRADPRRWPLRAQVEVAAWITAAVITVLIYFSGLQQKESGFPSSSWRYPVQSLQSVLGNIGNVFPTTTPNVGLHVFIGSTLLIVAAFVVVQCFRERLTNRLSVLPVTLIVFAVLFDLFVSSIRLALGVALSLAPRYTMANLLLLLGLIIYGLGYLSSSPSRAVRYHRLRLTVAGVLVVVVSIQLVVSAVNGLKGAEQSQANRLIGDRIAVNQGEYPPGEASCYAFVGLATYAGYLGKADALTEARSDNLSEFSSGPYRAYRAEGVPKIPECRQPVASH